uniref:ATP synthase F0 subunit 8 n=1 Tax=Zinaida jigongi TaxID=1329488 RepID=A0A0F6T367_ZINJI|nr:ATP synthase F0 subunit 8 [Zinaida jigongi]AKE07312.1 ATP synthase F0 subunit 8 [Zinaida jigongi]
MPQMMPINWIFSFIMFIWIFIMFNILNYYIFFLKINNKKNNNFFYLKKIFWKL